MIMGDRAVIAAIFLELTKVQFKRAKGFLKDKGVPAGSLEDVIDSEDMADLFMSQFEGSERKKIIHDILKSTKCANVIEKFKDYLSDSPQLGGDDGAVAAKNITSRATTSREGEQMPEREINPLALLYVSLSDGCLEGDLVTLKDLVDKDISPRKLEKMNNPTDIFKNLEDQGIISEKDVKYLKKLFQRMKKQKLVNEIEEFEAKYNLKT